MTSHIAGTRTEWLAARLEFSMGEVVDAALACAVWSTGLKSMALERTAEDMRAG